MAAASFRVDGFSVAPPPRSRDEAADQAMLRAYALERAVDYGCSLDDVVRLRRRVESGYDWTGVALQLAQDNEQRAARAADVGQASLASRFLFDAAACRRVAQAALEADPERRLQVYEDQARDFHAAMQLAEPAARGEFFEVLHHQRPHAAWLFRAPDFESGGATVLVWGGADGWCEAFAPSVPFYLARGVSVCLIELPGQGLARLRHGSPLAADFTGLVSASLDALQARAAQALRFGVVGHSAGGSFALAAAAADDRIRACCSNGGSAQLLQGLRQFPRVLQRFGRMLGHATTPAQVDAFFDAVDLPQAARSMRAKLLCLQGGQDPLVTDDEARQLVAWRGAEAATLEYWPEGLHCVYNHAVERNCVIADWLAAQLASEPGAATHSTRRIP